MRFASKKSIPGATFLDGVSFAPKGRFWSKLGVSKYRTIWLKTAVFPIWPRAKMGDFDPPKKGLFWRHKNMKNLVFRQPTIDDINNPPLPPALSWLHGIVSALVVTKKNQRLKLKQKEIKEHN